MMMGPLSDRYQETVEQWVGSCLLLAPTAFVYHSLGPRFAALLLLGVGVGVWAGPLSEFVADRVTARSVETDGGRSVDQDDVEQATDQEVRQAVEQAETDRFGEV